VELGLVVPELATLGLLGLIGVDELTDGAEDGLAGSVLGCGDGAVQPTNSKAAATAAPTNR